MHAEAMAYDDVPHGDGLVRGGRAAARARERRLDPAVEHLRQRTLERMRLQEEAEGRYEPSFGE